MRKIAPVADQTKEILDRVEKLTDRELARIDSLHAQSIRFIKVILGTLAVVGSGVAYFGFQNLRDMAVSVAKSEVRHEVEIQVRDKLNKEGITAIVNQQIQDFVSRELRSTLIAQVKTGSLHQEILKVASAQSQELIVKTIGQRRLSPENAAKLIAAINGETSLKGYWIGVSGPDSNGEADRYANDISNAIKASNAKLMEASYGVPLPASSPVGVVIYYETSQKAAPANVLSRCLEAAGIVAPVAAAEFQHLMPTTPENPLKPMIFVKIGPRPLPETK